MRTRRQTVDAAFDAAVHALLLVQASRHISTGLERQLHPGPDQRFEDFRARMTEDSIEYFVAQMRHARASLVAITRYVPEARNWVLSGWELTEEREPEQRRVIEARRAAALQSERLFRASKVPMTETVGQCG